MRGGTAPSEIVVPAGETKKALRSPAPLLSPWWKLSAT